MYPSDPNKGFIDPDVSIKCATLLIKSVNMRTSEDIRTNILFALNFGYLPKIR